MTVNNQLTTTSLLVILGCRRCTNVTTITSTSCGQDQFTITQTTITVNTSINSYKCMTRYNSTSDVYSAQNSSSFVTYIN